MSVPIRIETETLRTTRHLEINRTDDDLDVTAVTVTNPILPDWQGVVPPTIWRLIELDEIHYSDFGGTEN